MGAHHCMLFGRVGDLQGAEVKTMAKVVQMLQIEIMSSTMHIKQAIFFGSGQTIAAHVHIKSSD